MNLQNQCITLDQARKLKELGICQQSYISWFQIGQKQLLRPSVKLNDEGQAEFTFSQPIASAFTSGELTSILPTGIGTLRFSMWKGVGYFARYASYDGSVRDRYEVQEDTAAEALCALLIEIIDDNLITVTEINLRICDLQ